MNTDIHRLLDEAFDGVAMTPEARELKEEVRANLMARAAELEAAGSSKADAARTAIAELGPVEDLLGSPTGVRTTNAPRPTAAELHALNKVRPNPAFVVRATLLSVGATATATLAVLAAFDVVDGGSVAVLGLGLATAAILGFVTADSLRQETTSNYPMPAGRAVGWGTATFAGLASLASFAAFANDTALVALAIAGGALALASIGLFSWLGATQTNRHKSWVTGVSNHQAYGQPNRFETDVAAASRFGIYSGVIWLAGIGVAIWLAIAFAWWWVLVVLGVCTVASMLLLASMLYGSKAAGGESE